MHVYTETNTKYSTEIDFAKAANGRENQSAFLRRVVNGFLLCCAEAHLSRERSMLIRKTGRSVPCLSYSRWQTDCATSMGQPHLPPSSLLSFLPLLFFFCFDIKKRPIPNITNDKEDLLTVWCESRWTVLWFGFAVTPTNLYKAQVTSFLVGTFKPEVCSLTNHSYFWVQCHTRWLKDSRLRTGFQTCKMTDWINQSANK